MKVKWRGRRRRGQGVVEGELERKGEIVEEGGDSMEERRKWITNVEEWRRQMKKMESRSRRRA